MRAEAFEVPVGPIMVTGQKFPSTHKGYVGPVNWFCEATNGAKVVVETTETASKRDIEEFLASGPEIKVVGN